MQYKRKTHDLSEGYEKHTQFVKTLYATNQRVCVTNIVYFTYPTHKTGKYIKMKQLWILHLSNKTAYTDSLLSFLHIFQHHWWWCWVTYELKVPVVVHVSNPWHQTRVVSWLSAVKITTIFLWLPPAHFLIIIPPYTSTGSQILSIDMT